MGWRADRQEVLAHVATDGWTLVWAGLLLTSLGVGAVAGVALARSVAGDHSQGAHRWSRLLLATGVVAFMTSLALGVNLYGLNV